MTGRDNSEPATVTLSGLNWSHRRATGPLEALSAAFSRDRADITIKWSIRPLNDFEHQPIADIAHRHDLLVIDHPFCGDIEAFSALMPLEVSMPGLLGVQAEPLYVGPSLSSYRYAGHVWAAPIDAAAVHAAYRADLLADNDEPVPVHWEEALALGRRLRQRGLHLITPITSPHAFATLASLMANLGKPLEIGPDGRLSINLAAMHLAMDALDELVGLSPPESLAWNAIDVQEAMVSRDDLAFCPAIFGYATYAENDHRRPLRFSEFCGLRSPYAAGAMLGGTGLAVSASTRNPSAALDFVRFCLSPQAQTQIIPSHHGQPALAAAWTNAKNDALFGGYYSGVRSTIENAWIRPRMRLAIQYQAEAGRIAQAYCRRETDRQSTIDGILAASKCLQQDGDRQE